MNKSSLHARLIAECAASRLAPEHLELAGALKEAAAFVVSADAAMAARRELDENCWAIESNLDLIYWPTIPVWIEWELPSRSLEADNKDGRCGCMIYPHPEEPDLLMAVTGWEDYDSGTISHAFCVAMFSPEEIHEHALMARRRYSRDSHMSFDRLMTLFSVTMPIGFRDELVLKHDGDVAQIAHSLLLGTAELPFLLTLLLARDVQGGFILDLAGNENRYQLAPACERNRLETFADRLLKAKHAGITRHVKNRKPVLKWYRPAANASS